MSEIIPVQSTAIQLSSLPPLPEIMLPAVNQFIAALGIPREWPTKFSAMPASGLG